MIEIRKATIADIEAIVDVNIKTWRTTYKGIINQKTLDQLEKNREEKIKRFKDNFLEQKVFKEQLVAVRDNRVIGFVNYGKNREQEWGEAGEIYAIYVLEEYQKCGIGKELIHNAVKNMVEKTNYKKMIIWTLRDNSNKKFYEKIGGEEKFEKIISIKGEELEEIGYVYKNLEKLIEGTRNNNG